VGAVRRWERAPDHWNPAGIGVWFAPSAIVRISETRYDAETCEVKLSSGNEYTLAMPAAEVAALIAADLKSA
jgi:hypothetical protein